MDIDDAIAAHIRWKLCFFQWLQGNSPPPQEGIGAPERCKLGRLLGACEPRWHRLASYRLAKTAHELFHLRAAEIVSMAGREGLERARPMVEPGTPYAAASDAILLALTRLLADTRRKHAPALRIPPEATAA